MCFTLCTTIMYEHIYQQLYNYFPVKYFKFNISSVEDWASSYNWKSNDISNSYVASYLQKNLNEQEAYSSWARK